MTEISLLWNGIITGDATLAPYDKELFNTYLAGIHVDSLDQVYVVPGYLNDLEVVENGSLGFSVKSGGALFGEYVYINSADLSFSVDAPEDGSFRYDLVVLDIDRPKQKVRIKLLKGSDTTSYLTLADPPVTSNQSIIARLYVDSVNAMLEEQYIYDQRRFAHNNFTINRYGGFLGNLVRNSEFMAFSSADGSRPPDMWRAYYDASPAAATFDRIVVSYLETFKRGTWIRIDGIDNAGFSQDFEYNDVRFNDKLTLTVKGVVALLDAGSTVTITLASQNGGLEQTILRSQTFEKIPAEEFHYQFTIPYDASEVNGFRLIFTGTDQYIAIGPVVVVPGYHPGPFRPFNEIIPFEEPVTDAAWSATAKSTGATTINFSADFNGAIVPFTRAVIVKLRANDSGSLAGGPNLVAQGTVANYGAVYLAGVANDIPREISCVVPIIQNLTISKAIYGQMGLFVNASGAGTLDATVEIIGIVV